MNAYPKSYAWFIQRQIAFPESIANLNNLAFLGFKSALTVFIPVKDWISTENLSRLSHDITTNITRNNTGLTLVVKDRTAIVQGQQSST